MSFTTDLQKYHKKYGKLFFEIQRGAALELFSAIIVGTPVAFGTLRANWFVSIGQPSDEITKATDTSGDTTIRRAEARVDSSSYSQPIWFTNNLDYAAPIEFDGISGKAPQGMVRVNTARWDKIVESVAREVAGRLS